MVDDVVVAVGAEPDEAVGAAVVDIVIAVGHYFDEIVGAGGVDVGIAAAKDENFGGVGGVVVGDVVIAAAADADELSSGRGIAGCDSVVAAADVDDKLADGADRDILVAVEGDDIDGGVGQVADLDVVIAAPQADKHPVDIGERSGAQVGSKVGAAAGAGCHLDVVVAGARVHDEQGAVEVAHMGRCRRDGDEVNRFLEEAIGVGPRRGIHRRKGRRPRRRGIGNLARGNDGGPPRCARGRRGIESSRPP